MKSSVLMEGGEWAFKNSRPEHRKASVKRITQGLLIISAEVAHNLRRHTLLKLPPFSAAATVAGARALATVCGDAGAVPQLLCAATAMTAQGPALFGLMSAYPGCRHL
jgi:hypothetical protein